MDAAQLGAVSAIVVGLTAATASLVGHRGASRSAREGQVLGGYSTLVDDLQEERDKVRAQLVEKDSALAAAFAELAAERAGAAVLHRQIADLTTERDELRRRLAELEGRPA